MKMYIQMPKAFLHFMTNKSKRGYLMVSLPTPTKWKAYGFYRHEETLGCDCVHHLCISIVDFAEERLLLFSVKCRLHHEWRRTVSLSHHS